MDIFNIGSGELVFLVIFAILIVGPRRAAELASQAGRLLTRLRREWYSVRRDVMAEVTALEKEVQLPQKPTLEIPELDVGTILPAEDEAALPTEDETE
jgi:Sec-independent protein translocase protein TatA